MRQLDGVDERQAASLEAIAFGLDVVDLVYRRLVLMLGTDAVPPPQLAFADAWAIIDWMKRLDWLVNDCRGLSPRDSHVRTFLDSSSLTENMRHAFQHPATALIEMSQSGRSVWGHLSWQKRTEEGHEVRTIAGYGGFVGGAYRASADVNHAPRADVDRVSLFSADGEVEIGLTGQHEAVVRLAHQLEAAVQMSAKPDRIGEIMRIDRWPA